LVPFPGVSEVSCEPDVKPFLDLSKKQEQPQQQQQKPPQPQQKQLQIAESEEISRKRAKLRFVIFFSGLSVGKANFKIPFGITFTDS